MLADADRPRLGLALEQREADAARAAAFVLRHPREFIARTLKSFRANQGLLLAGAVAYNALLSIVPMLILFVIALSHFVDPEQLLETLRRYLEWVMPGQSGAVVGELSNFLVHRDVAGWVLLGTMLFFSSLAFTMLESAMSVIFRHRVEVKARRFIVSALLPYCFMVLLGVGFMLVTLVFWIRNAFGALVVLGWGLAMDGYLIVPDVHIAEALQYRLLDQPC